MRDNMPICQMLAASIHALRPATIERMNNLIISINWEYFLGVIGTLIAIAYYANGRITRLETSVEWLKETLRGLKIASENGTMRFFETRSPISLTKAGQRALDQSGMKAYIDAHREELTRKCQPKRAFDPCEVQICAFRLFADRPFEGSFEHQLNEFAYANSISADLLRRVGAVYLRDTAISAR